MNVTPPRIGELLVSYKLITPEQLQRALDLQRVQMKPIGQILLEQGFISEERLLQMCALQKGVTPWHLQNDPPTPEALTLVPAQVCRKHKCLPVQIKGSHLILAMRDPGDIEAIDLIRNLCKLRVDPVLVNEDRLEEAISAAYSQIGTANTLDRLVTEAMIEFKEDASDRLTEGVPSDAEIRPVVGMIDQILAEAVRRQASDIHFEPRQDRIDVRYRIDGQMQRVHQLPLRLKEALTARLKIMSHLDIVEYRVPQDGRFTISCDGRQVDLRISTLPNYHGQRIVLRLLDKSVAVRQLGELGFSAHNHGLFRDMIHKPYGLILVTGPTGSGKTTTLYAALNQLKQVTRNIMTCEDPVEYDIDGINQSHVNEKVGLTFAAQLRAILRQDPDVVLVGEIRDRETAETAIRAALTGHLVLSTLHCNDAPSAIPRLADMGVEPFLLSTALIGITAQRLVRLLCPHCKESYAPDQRERSQWGSEIALSQAWRPVGCPKCDSSGYRGRIGIHEVLPTPHDVRRAIAAHEPLETVSQMAARFGYQPMQADACYRLLSGQTSFAEVQRQIFFEAAATTEIELKRAA